MAYRTVVLDTLVGLFCLLLTSSAIVNFLFMWCPFPFFIIMWMHGTICSQALILVFYFGFGQDRPHVSNISLAVDTNSLELLIVALSRVLLCNQNSL